MGALQDTSSFLDRVVASTMPDSSKHELFASMRELVKIVKEDSKAGAVSADFPSLDPAKHSRCGQAQTETACRYGWHPRHSTIHKAGRSVLKASNPYRATPQGLLTPRMEHIHNGRFKAKTGVAEHADSSHAYSQYKFTPTGVAWITGEWGKHKVRQVQQRPARGSIGNFFAALDNRMEGKQQ